MKKPTFVVHLTDGESICDEKYLEPEYLKKLGRIPQVWVIEDNDDEFNIQDIIHNEINKALSITEDDVCPKCNQYPYSDTDKHCPVCFDVIGDDKSKGEWNEENKNTRHWGLLLYWG